MAEPHPELPDSYMQFAHRGHGMDHDIYDWSMMHRRKPVTWPGGARVAVWVNVALEFFPLNQPAQPFKAPGGMVTPYPDLRHYTLRDYGNRIGVFRVLKLLDRLAIRPSVSFNSKVAERYPRLMTEVADRGWEVIANGVDMGSLHHGGLAVDNEVALIDEVLDVLRSASGQPVTGWLSPARSESTNTLDLLAARGIEYVCDWYNDDMPFPLTTANGVVHAMPLSHELDDQTVQLHYHQSEHSFADQVSDAATVVHRESSPDDGRILSVTIHPWMSGQPHRIAALTRALESLVGPDDVWSAPGSEILAAFRSQQ